MSVHEKMTAIANAIRGKTGKTDALTLDQMATEIAGIEAGGGYTIEDIAQADKISGDIVLKNLTLREYAFAYCKNINKVVLNEGVRTNNATCACFEGSSIVEASGNLKSDYMFPHNGGFPNLFRNCKSLKKIAMPNFIPYTNACQYCTALEYVDIYRVNGSNVFNGCTSLKVIVLRGGEVRALSMNNNAWDFPLNNTQFDPDNANATGGYVLVPSALVSEYQVATNWSIIHEAGKCTFLPLEEYTVDGTTSGEIDMDKLNATIGAT